MGDTLREFLVGLGWKINEGEQDRFTRALEAATLRAKLLGDMLEALARKAADMVASVATSFDQIYFAAQRMNTSVATIKDFGYAIEQLGGSASGARASLESMAEKLRANPGNIVWLNELGFGLNKTTKQLEVQNDLMQKAANMPLQNAKILAGLVGLDEQTLLAERHAAELQALMAESAKFREQIGFNAETAASDANAFMTIWRRVSMEIGGLADDLWTKLMKALTGPFQEFQRFIEANGPAIGKAIDTVTDAIGKMAAAWVASFEDMINKPDAYKNLRDGMQGFANAIKSAADALSSLVANLRWLNDFGNAGANVLNRFMGLPEVGRDPGAAAPQSLQDFNEKMSKDRAPEVKSWFGKKWGAVKNFFGVGGGEGEGGGKVTGDLDAKGAAGYNQVYAAAKAGGDPFPEVTAGQWAIESGWGKHTPAGSNNFFGQTTDGVPGHWARYATPQEGLEAHMKKWNPKYGNAKTPEEAIHNLVAAGYTPDPGYAESVLRAIRTAKSVTGAPAASVGDGSIAGDISGQSTYRRRGEPLASLEGFIMHHTGGRGTPSSVVNTLNQRGLGVQFVMDRDGKIYRTLPDGSRGAHILDSSINNLSNSNTEGMEVIANDDRDVTAAQRASGLAFLNKLHREHPDLQVFGHGEVNPGHREPSEGMSIVNAYRAGLLKPAIASRSIPTLKAPMRPGGSMADFFGTPSLSSGMGGDVTNISAPHHTEIHVEGSGDPTAVAHMVGANQSHVAATMARHLQGATQ